MCGRVTLLSLDELIEVARQLDASVHGIDMPQWPAQSRPGDQLPLFAACDDDTHDLSLAILTWGYIAPWNQRLVYNARIESADNTLWADSFASRRGIVPVASFFEPHRSETQRNPNSGRMGKRSYNFRARGKEPLLLGAVFEEERVSIVTTEPNASVAFVHDRMPLVVEKDEVGAWLGPDWKTLADRERVTLDSRPEFEEPVAPDQLALF